jgi:hypothetical protein
VPQSGVQALDPLKWILPLVLLLCGCGAAKAGAHDRHVPSIQATPSAPWIDTAEHQSEELLRNQCMMVAPLDRAMDAADPELRECSSRAERAVERGWVNATSAARASCVSTGLECCLDWMPGRSSQRELERYRERLTQCNAGCGAERGRTPQPNQGCAPKSVWARAPNLLDRFRTANVATIVALCEAHPEALTRCEGLTTTAERTQCTLDCEDAIERPVYDRAVDTCVKSGASATTAVCHFKSPLVEPAMTETLCTERCRAQLAEESSSTESR